MINKMNLLGKPPDELGTKDAVHVAIVAVRAAGPISPGERCGLNDKREATRDAKGPGVADPFRKDRILTGQTFWLLLDLAEVPNVQHVWQHPTIDFAPPTTEVKLNSELKRQAEAYGVTYEQLLAACAFVIARDTPAEYPGSKSKEELEAANEDRWDLWSSWSHESGHEFENTGTGCCPEYDYPRRLF